MRDEQSKFEAKGAKVAFIGMGLPLMAKDFRAQMHVTAPVLVDRTKESYRALGLGRGTLAQILSPLELIPGIGAILRHGYRSPKQDYQQYGGALVIAKGGEVRFEHKARKASDIIPVAKLLAAV